MTPYSPRAVISHSDVPAVSASTLPPQLRQIVERVLKRTRLWPSERADVESELAAHFADGLASGASIEKLVEDFGDPAAAAGLIRRAKIRSRSRAWHAQRMARNVILGAIGLLAVSYGAIALRYYAGTPTITRDVRKEFNAPIASIPQSQRAWPIYKLALSAVVNPGREKATDESGRGLPPLSPFESIEGASANQRAIALLRRAAALPKLGLEIDDPEDYVFINRQLARLNADKDWETKEIPAPPREGEPAISIVLPHLVPLRSFSRLLMQDVDLAVKAADAQAVSDDLVAAMRLAVLTRESPFLITDLVSLAMGELVLRKLQEVLTFTPALVTDNALKQFSAALVDMGPRPQLVRFDAELQSFDDILQRSFTDDRNGDGRMTPAGARLLTRASQFSGTNQVVDVGTVAALPIASTFGPSRKSLRQMYVSLVEQSKQWNAQPPWSRSAPPDPDALKAQTLPLSPYSFISLLLPAFNNSIYAADKFDTDRGATLAIIALEQYRRKHGAFPASLSELVPSFLSSLPLDLADGQPLRYKLIGKSFVLYSLGADRNDNGGTLPPTASAAVGISNFHFPIDAAKANYDWVFFPFVQLPKDEPKP